MLPLILFSIVLICSIVSDGSIVLALLVGYAIFSIYALLKGYDLKHVAKAALDGMSNIKGLLVIFGLVGALTAALRSCGTIPFLVCCAVKLCRPEVMLAVTFLLNAGVSLLIGTCFGTAATIGTICATVAASMGLDSAMIGGAVLSGVFVGDRASPLSSGAILVSNITGTDLYDNVAAMLRNGLLPALVTTALYAWLGRSEGVPVMTEMESVFSVEFQLNWLLLLPLVLIPVLSLLHLNVKISMLAAVLTAMLLSLFVQKIPPFFLLRQLILGYSSPNPEIDVLLHGGGVVSMARTAAIITISSTYTGIFKMTGILTPVKEFAKRISKRITPIAAMIAVSLITGMVSCNQMFSVMLTRQIFEEIIPDQSELALTMEDTTVLIAPMIPWSIAASVPLVSANAPSRSILFAFYLYLVPLFALLRSLRWSIWKKPISATETAKVIHAGEATIESERSAVDTNAERRACQQPDGAK